MDTLNSTKKRIKVEKIRKKMNKKRKRGREVEKSKLKKIKILN